ncbi:MAG: 3-isopropylmalate dehydratase small subunit [Candidatus Omnitrophica bacterium]|nr:3-isopropylmalate dehydratase small subunit [Candidatus Omnitrophota bacterium]
MIIKGRVHKLGDDINTDDIISAKHLVYTDAEQLGKYCLESIRPDFVNKVKPGDIIVAGKNFGCGSSREHAPLAIKGCGIKAVIAKSFAAIFFRNAINIGLPFLESGDADKINDGDTLEIDLSRGVIKNLTTNQVYQTEVFPEFLQEIVEQGGLINSVKAKSK